MSLVFEISQQIICKSAKNLVSLQSQKQQLNDNESNNHQEEREK